MARGYRYECLKCHNLDTIAESRLKIGNGCNVCCVPSRKVLIGYNDTWTTRPDLAEMMWDHEDGYKYTVNSHHKIDWRCNECGDRIKNRSLNGVFKQGLSCTRCSDGVSYPNKWIFSVAKELKKKIELSGHFIFKFETEYQPDWAFIKEHEDEKLNGKKIYDIKISVLDIRTKQSLCFINELHGLQHYKGRTRGSARTVEQEQENDRLKRELNDIYERNIYSEIDARISNFDFIMNNFINSKFKNELDKFIGYDCLQDFDSLKVRTECEGSLVKAVCECFNEQKEASLADIASIMGLGISTVRDYLKRGSGIGWCDYDAKMEKYKGSSKAGKMAGKPVVRLSLNWKYIDEWQSASEAGRQLNLHAQSISSVCRGKRNCRQVGGFIFMYKKDFEKINKDNLEPYKRRVVTKEIVQLSLDGEYLGEFESSKQAATQLKLFNSSISLVCNNKQSQTGGYIFMFKSDYKSLKV